MFKFVEYHQGFEGFRGRIDGLPGWARGLIFIAALPGLALIALSVLALLVSILALLLLTVPLYRVLRAVAGPATTSEAGAAAESGAFGVPAGFGNLDPGSPGRKKVDVTIIE